MQYREDTELKSSKLEKIQVATPFIIATVLSVLGMYLNYKNIRTDNGRAVWNYLPYFKITTIGILLTSLMATVMVQQHKLEGKETEKYDFSGAIALFCFGVAPVISLLLYPGLEQLHLTSDPAWLGAWAAFVTTQAFLFYRELRRNLGHKFDFRAILIGTVINLVIVIVTPYSHNISGGSSRYEIDEQGE